MRQSSIRRTPKADRQNRNPPSGAGYVQRKEVHYLIAQFWDNLKDLLTQPNAAEMVRARVLNLICESAADARVTDEDMLRIKLVAEMINKNISEVVGNSEELIHPSSAARLTDHREIIDPSKKKYETDPADI